MFKDCGNCLEKIIEWFWLVWGISAIIWMVSGLIEKDADKRRYCGVMGMLCAVMFEIKSSKSKREAEDKNYAG